VHLSENVAYFLYCFVKIHWHAADQFYYKCNPVFVCKNMYFFLEMSPWHHSGLLHNYEFFKCSMQLSPLEPSYNTLASIYTIKQGHRGLLSLIIIPLWYISFLNTCFRVKVGFGPGKSNCFVLSVTYNIQNMNI
jgi:hypothetical protein